MPPQQLQLAKQDKVKFWLICAWQAKPSYDVLENLKIYGSPALWNIRVNIDEREVINLTQVDFKNVLSEVRKIKASKKGLLEVFVDVLGIRQDGQLELVASNNINSPDLSLRQKKLAKEKCSDISTIFFLENFVSDASKITHTLQANLPICDINDVFIEAIYKIQIRK